MLILPTVYAKRLIQALMFLLRRCYGLIYRLMSESEPISEELLPIASPPPPFFSQRTQKLT